MPLNLGYVEGTCRNGAVVVRIYYDAALPASSTQPLINGPRGYCLDLTNTSGQPVTVTVSGVTATPLVAILGQGNPITAGQASSRTAVELAALGFTTRGSIGNFTLDCQ